MQIQNQSQKALELKIKELEIMFDAFESDSYDHKYVLDAKDKYLVHYLDKDLLELQKDYLTQYPESIVIYDKQIEEKSKYVPPEIKV